MTKVEPRSPNDGNIQIGDIFLKLNNQRVLTVSDFTKAIDSSTDKSSIAAVVVRDGKEKKLEFKAFDATADILNLNMNIINSACDVREVKERDVCAMRNISSEK